jgi:hypothetical protein
MACDNAAGSSTSSPGTTTYTATANGAAGTTTSTAIAFTFNEAVNGLTATDITLANGTGSVTKGELTGSGQTWSLAITVATVGNVTVSINKTGIESGAKTVAVYKAGETQPVAYTAAADGTAGTTTSTAITLTFNEAVSGLTAGDITLVNGSGSVTKGALIGSGQAWSLAITVATAGNVTVSINKTGIASGAKTVAVHKTGETPTFDTGTKTIAIGFNYGAIAITGSNGTNVIYKTSADPKSLVLSAAGYTDMNWYVDGDNTAAGTGNSITINANDYSAKAHSITFTGTKDGKVYSQTITFTVRN